MDDLIKQLTAKTGLGADKIKEVVEGVMDFIGDKLPGPVAGQVKKLLGGDGDGGGDEGGGLMGKAKGMFGG